MDNKKSHAERIANLADALADLSSQDLEEAKAVLAAAGKDPDIVLANGLKALQNVRLKYTPRSQGQGSVEDESIQRRGRALVIATTSVENTIDLVPYSQSNVVLDADQVYRTFLKREPSGQKALSDLAVSAAVRNLKFNKLVRSLRFTIVIGGENAKVFASVKERSELIPVELDELSIILQLGYYIVNNNWLPIDRKALDFLTSFITDLDSECLLPLNKALYYFSKRQSFEWLIFRDEELDLTKILTSDRYASESNLFTRTLYPYQKEGLQWLLFCCLNSIGGVLADDMGLGKTAQTIALIAWIVERNFFQNTLIVVPGTLLENWRREFEFFAPSIVPYIHHGSERSGSIRLLESQNVVITSYAMVINDQFLLDKISWGLLLLDEASLIKNPDSERRNAVSSLQAQVRVAMTGTPVENSLIDLWSIVDFVNPGYLGSKDEFSSRYVKRDIQTTLLHSDLATLKKDVSYIMLRRKKEEVLDMLPEKIDIHQALEMESDELSSYNDRRDAVLDAGGAPGAVFRLIQDLRQFTTHPLLLDPERIKAADLLELKSSSSKFRRTLELIDEIRSNNEEALVFTEYLDMIDAFSRILSAHYGIPVYTIDGRVDTSDRQARIDQFTEASGFSIMILNPKTAGMGLNITAANHVIHYTRQWNPALEEQATARAYRNRQIRNVSVYYLYYVNTIEELIDTRLRAKTTLSGEVISVTEHDLSNEDYIAYLSKTKR